MEGALVGVERRGDVCVLMLRRPDKLNALSYAVEEALVAALSSGELRTSRAVVIAGEGRAFSAGADVTEFREATPESILAYYRATGAVCEEFASLPQPSIAALHGWCVGGPPIRQGNLHPPGLGWTVDLRLGALGHPS